MYSSDQNTPNPNPKASANCFSRIFYWYTVPTFRHGWKRGFTEDELYQVMPEYRSEMLGDALEAAWSKELSRRKPSLLKALCRVFGWIFLKFSIMLMAIQLGRIGQVVALYYLMKYFEEEQTELSIGHAYICATFIVISSFALVMSMHGYMLSLQQLGMMARIACCSLVFRKSLRLTRSAVEGASVGKMINLLSNDVNRFDYVCIHLPFIFDIPVELVACLILLYYFASTHPYAGLAVFVLLVPLQILLGYVFSKLRKQTAIRTDERVRLMNEVLSGIEVIKMHTWEQSFAETISKARKREIRQIRWSCYVKSIFMSLTIFTSRIAVFIALAVYIIDDNILNAPYVYFIVALFAVLRHSMTIALPTAISQVAETIVAIRRLEAFFLSEEQSSTKLVHASISWQSNSEEMDDVYITAENVTAGWSHSADVIDNMALKNISFHLEKGQKMAVIGVVGSGKTSLLNLLLNELFISSGVLDVTGVISYAAQEPWLFTGSIKQNILFGEEYDHARYNKVLTVCALKRDLTLLPFGEDTIIGERGVSLSGGQRARLSLARAVYKEADIYLLDDPLSAVDGKVANVIFEDCVMDFLQGKCIILVTHQHQFLRDVAMIMVLQDGEVSFLGNYEEMLEAKPELVTRLEDKVDENNKTKPEQNEIDSFNLNWRTTLKLPKETFNVGAVNCKVYMAYAKASGTWFELFLIIALFLITQFLASSCDFFIPYWVSVETLRATHSSDTDTFGYALQSRTVYIGIYSVLILVTVIVTLVRSVAYFSMCMNASVKLHKNMFYAVVSAPMAFFNKQLSGRILNRFSKDMGTIDDQFPYVTLDTVQIGLAVLGVIVITVVINPYMMIPIALILVVFYFLRIFYLRTGRNIKRLEGVTRSPVFTHLNTAMQGLATIRACKAQQNSVVEFDAFQDIHSAAWDMFLVTSRAFGLWLDMICCIFIAFVVYGFLLIFTDTYDANVGLSITQAIMLTGMFQWGMRQWSEMENNMTSVERVYEYTQIEHEVCAKPPQSPPPYWPKTGTIEFHHVYLKYSETEPYILRDLNFYIKPNQKIGIVGRTGAGKSSLITSLFQLAKTEGEIILDGIDIQTIPLKNLRSKIAIIPQEPILFAGTLRRNLDPFQEHSDTLLWKALEDVAMLATVCRLPEGLESIISEGGINFSVGQRQLLCLARAIVRSNRILILDEATANVDPQTDDLIQTTIREKFRFCTVLTIAHRLHTILDSDKVLVMDAGRAVEFGYSYVLLQNKEGIFYALVESSGLRLKQEIYRISKRNYYLRLKKGLLNPPKPLEPEDTLAEDEESSFMENISGQSSFSNF